MYWACVRPGQLPQHVDCASNTCQGAVGLAIWVPSVTNQPKATESSDTRVLAQGYSSLSSVEDKKEAIWRETGDGGDLELCVIGSTVDPNIKNEEILLDDLKVSQAMSKNFVRVSLTMTLKETIKVMNDSQQNCVLVVDTDDLLEGILTLGDIQRRISKMSSATPNGDSTVSDLNTCLVSSIFTGGIHYRGRQRGLLTCYPDTDLAIAKDLMEAKGIKQLPVVRRGGDLKKERKRRVVALLHYDLIWRYLREEIDRHSSVLPAEE